MRSKQGRLGPLFPYPYKSHLSWFYTYYLKRLPVFVAGTYIGSKLVWAIEDVTGEDAMVKVRNPMMVASGFAALWLVYFRGKVVSFVRTPVTAALVAFSMVWLIDGYYLSRRGFDTLWNPFYLSLPRPVVSALTSDPFAEGLVVGPITYAATGFLNAVMLSVHTVFSSIPKSIRSALPSRDPESPTGNSNDDAIARIDKNIQLLEERALVDAGVLSVEDTSFGSYGLQMLHERQEDLENYDNSIFNPLRYLPSFQERLSQSNLDFVQRLFRSGLPTALTPTFIPRPTNEIIFGNLNEGISQSMDAEYIEQIRLQLKDNALSEHPRPLGLAATPNFIRRQVIDGKYGAPIFIDPVGTVLSPVTSFLSTLSSWWLALGTNYAFDDRSATLRQPTAAQRSQFEDSEFTASTNPDQSNKIEDDSLTAIPYDLPPIIPVEVRERQKQRSLEERRLEREHAAQIATGKSLVTEEAPRILKEAGKLAVAGAGILTQEATQILSPSSSSNPPAISIREQFYIQADRRALADLASSRWLPDDEFYDIIKSSVDTSSQALLPEGITAEQRLSNFVQSVGGQDFEEPTYDTANSKLPFYRARRLRRTEVTPIAGERLREKTIELATSIKREYEVRRNLLSTTFSRARAQSQAQAEQRMKEYKIQQEASEKARQEAIERLKTKLKPLQQWFSDFSDRWTKP